MIVVSDTSPITALLTVGQAELLRKLFQEVVIPPAVNAELLRTHSVFPEWLQVRQLRSHAQALAYERVVDRGEAEAIALAQELKANWLLIDERKGRQLAQEASVPVLGLVGVILIARASRAGFVGTGVVRPIGTRRRCLFNGRAERSSSQISRRMKAN